MSLFDPVTGKLLDPDGLRQVQINAAGPTKPKTKVVDGKKAVQILHDGTGNQTGYNTFHGDGRVDATITPDTIVAKR